MFCNKCGTENTDESVFCVKCGERINAVANENENEIIIDKLQQLGEKTRKEEKQDKGKTNLYAGFLINIFSALALLLLVLLNTLVSDDGGSTNTGPTIIVGTSSKIMEYIGGCLFLINFAIGYTLYYVKKKALKETLSYIYLVLSIIALCTSFMANFDAFLCISTWIFIVPFVMQIVAGIKFIIGIKNYED